MPNISFGLVTAVTLSVAAVAVSGGCTTQKSESSSPKLSTSSLQKVSPEVVTPKHQRDPLVIPKIRTDSPQVAIGNLMAAIKTKSTLLEGGRADGNTQWELVHHHLTRARYLGQIDGFRSAENIVNALLKSQKPTADLLMLRADVHGALHRFEAASNDLMAAEAMGAKSTRVSRSRQGIALAQGQVTDVLKARKAMAERYPSWKSLSRLAVAYAAADRYEDADAAYVAALGKYRSTSPFVVAWIFFARGVMWAEAAGDTARGRVLYEAAVKHLPDYLVANIHLAELEAEAGQTAQAIRRLERLDQPNIDPELLGKLSGLMEKTGQHIKAKVYAKRGKAGYDTLLEWAPKAWSDHGTEFFMDVGKDPARALKLAKLNLATRATPRAKALVIEAAIESKRYESACAIIRTQGDTAPVQIRLREALQAARPHCTKSP
jgi:tetratricopeptide (TPR) repeat protein